MKSIQPHLKAIVAGLVTALGILGASVTTITVPVLLGAIGAGMAASAAVWFTPWVPAPVTIPVPTVVP